MCNILGGHGFRVKTLEALKFACESNISIICLPSDTTHWTAAAKKNVFKPLIMLLAYEC